jgi:hypothetical protein
MSAGSHFRHHYGDTLLLDGTYMYGGYIKLPKLWKRQGQVSATNDYDDDSTDYDSSTVGFGGTRQAAASVIKQRTDWTKPTKRRSAFRRQGATAPTTNYDGSTTDYDGSGVAYGGTGQAAGSVIKRKTDWKRRG